MKRLIVFLLAGTLLSGCAAGPNYVRPSAPTPQRFTTLDGWSPAAPADGLPKGDWWQVYNDPILNDLEQKVAINNQNVAAAEAVVRASAASVQQSRAALWPSLGLTLSGRQTRGSKTATSNNGTGATGGGANGDNYSLGLDGSWTIDIWGKVRREIQEARANNQAAEADLANATLSAQATLAVTYFDLRATEAQQAFMTDTVANYDKALSLTQNQYKVGVAQRSDVLSAQSQLATAKASLAALDLQRGQYVHAIATLIGTTPDQVEITAGSLAQAVPVTPPGLPTTLLQRRPDIAAAERDVAAANAAIGIADSAYFPSLSLSASDTAASSSLSRLFSLHNATWSVGADVADTLLDFGARRGAVNSAKANYDQAVAKYRQTVLSAFQDTEDNLLALRVLASEQVLREQAEASARDALQITLNQYKAGQVAYSSVITAQNTLLNAQSSTISVRQSRLEASVSLIEDLGGGWDDSHLNAH